jgi:hypothetical protein
LGGAFGVDAGCDPDPPHPDSTPDNTAVRTAALIAAAAARFTT